MATMKDLLPDEVAMLQNKPHPLYKGVLRVAMENGLKQLSVKVLQFPHPDNGMLAVCEATAVFRGEDGERIFTEVGDCDERNCGRMIAPHKVRMAATRAKGRALRDALGIGEALAEEMAPESRETHSAARRAEEPAVCAKDGCDRVLTAKEIDRCGKNARFFEGLLYCDAHSRDIWETYQIANRAKTPMGKVVG